jgi:hypothetical protein
MSAQSNPINATEMKIRENEIIQRRGKQIMKRLPFEINQIILMYLEDGRGINIMMLQSWRIFMASSAIRPNNNFEGFSGINEMMYNPFNEALNRCYRKTEAAYRYGYMCDDVTYMRRMTSLSSSPTSEKLRDFFNEFVVNTVARETQIRDMIISSDFFPHIGRYEYIRLIMEGHRGDATILIAQTPTHHNNTGVYETRELRNDNTIAEYGNAVRQIHHCDKYHPTNDRIRCRYRWVTDFNPEILHEIFIRFPQDVRKEIRLYYACHHKRIPETETIGHAHANGKLFNGSGVLTVEEIRFLQGSDLGRCLLLSMILLDIDANGRNTYVWNVAIFETFEDTYGARGNFKIFLIELLRIWGVEKMANEAYRWRNTIDEVHQELNPNTPREELLPNTARVCAYDGSVYKFERVFRLEDLDNEENYEDEDEDDDGDGGDY